MDKDNLEHKKRTEIVWGIIVAGIASFAVGLLVNTYYDLFVNVTTTWSKINHMQVYGAVLVLVAVVGLLNFFVADYKNDLEMDRSFWKRYRDYFFYSFAPGKFIRIIIGLYGLVITLGFLVLMYIFIAKIGGYFLATFINAAAILKIYLEEKRKKNVSR